jgi:F0F1-type ATP synthase membrane subunit b/b'
MRVTEPRVRFLADEEKIQKVLNVSKERAVEIGERLVEARKADNENLDAGNDLLAEYAKKQGEVNSIIGEASADTFEYADRLDKLSEAGEKSIGFETKRNQLFKDIEKELEGVNKELDDYEKLVRALTPQEERNVNVLEAKESLLLGLLRV